SSRLNGPSTPPDNTVAIALSTQTASVNPLTATLTCSAVSNTSHHPRIGDTPQHKRLHLPAASPSQRARQHQNRRVEPAQRRRVGPRGRSALPPGGGPPPPSSRRRSALTSLRNPVAIACPFQACASAIAAPAWWRRVGVSASGAGSS